MLNYKDLVGNLVFNHSEANAALGAGQSLNVLLKLPAASGSFAGAILSLDANVTGNARLALFESTTVSADGAARTPQSRNRISAPTCPIGVFGGPTVTGDGTQLELVGAQDPVTTCEWILKPGTNYLARLTNDAAGAIAAVVRVGLIIVPFREWFTARAG